MNYKVLYRKYRPNNFDELIGQEHIIKILKNSIIENKIAHAYLFTGPRGTGKTSTAKLFAKALNCTNSTNGIPCEKCDNCKNFNNNPDIIELDAASNNGVDNMRLIIDGVQVAPAMSKYKIYIIDEAHMLSSSAWNAFLKTLEEPPENVIFILATTEIQKVPLTILSRCQRFDFCRINKDEITKHLEKICEKENIKYEEDAIKEISNISDGCMRDALSVLDQLSKAADVVTVDILKQNYGTVTDYDIDIIYTAILHNDLDTLIDKISEIKASGVNIKVLIDKLIDNFLNKAIQIKRKNISNNAFNQLKNIIKSLNEIEEKLNDGLNGYLLLQIELISFINDDENKISNREINKIISREIIQLDTKIDVNKMIKDNKSDNYYKMCDEFINVRINNSFVNASKNIKQDFINTWNDFIKYIKEEDIRDILAVTRDSIPMVASEKNAIIVVKSESTKVILNAKLYFIENKFSKKFNKNYELIFISENDWKKLLKTFDKNKQYTIMEEEEFINKDNTFVTEAKELFGDKNINIE